MNEAANTRRNTRPGSSEGFEDVLVDVRNLKMFFPVTEGVFIPKVVAHVKAVNDVSFKIFKGETLGVVGESGCGKTTTGRCILQLEKPTAGEIIFNGDDITKYDSKQMIDVRKKIQVIFQDPYSSLNPRMKVGEILMEPMKVHKIITDEVERQKRAKYLLNVCGLASAFADRYPHEMSGGQRQRVGIARALAMDPEFIICDEAVSALDVSIKAQVCNLLLDLQQKMNLAYLFISHDMAVVERVSHRVAVMYLGEIVEIGPRAAVFENPQHAYTKKLMAAVPVPDPSRRRLRRDMPAEELHSPFRPAGYVPPPRSYREVSDGHLVRVD